MTETQEQAAGAPAAAAGSARGKKGSLNSLLLPELQQIASGMGISTAKVKKSDLIAAIQAARSGGSGSGSVNGATTERADAPAQANGRRPQRASGSSAAERTAESDARAENNGASHAETPAAAEPAAAEQRDGDRDGQNRREPRDGQNRQQRDGQNRQNSQNQNNERQQSGDRQGNDRQQSGDRQGNDRQQNNSGNQNRQQNSGGSQNQNRDNRDDDYEGGGRRRGRRYRDRRGRSRDREGGGANTEIEPTVSEDDVLIPVAGIVDAIEEKNTWFVRTNGYFASTDDVYVANSYVRRFGLRRGDAITGAVRQQREGERREKYNPLVRLDTVNGKEPDQGKGRVEFTKLTPLYPQERLRLETEPHIFTTRVIDLVMPIGKGQRALIVSPPKAGKTMVLQSIANAITVNNPEVHLMVVLIDERPEEVTDMQRSVKGEVIASTFDRRPQDHITVAELSIERAKRLVEMGHDVVVLLDSITRLGRAYNLGAPASGRILSGGVDSTALYPPKRFLGAARNIENGGSLTILATALVETGSAGDTVIFEEFKGTGNAELKLDRKIADKRVFPAVDVDQSSTRKEELLLTPDELAVTIKLRRVLHALDPQQAIDLLLDRLRKTRNNTEFLMQIAKTTPGSD
ncbi:MAG TPA: transcription termination factor Rho [Jatrophihabitantaceae bacterium]|nr:transcription termination factor Rho [Jatrophihabitantaceae bacterium]